MKSCGSQDLRARKPSTRRGDTEARGAEPDGDGRDVVRIPLTLVRADHYPPRDGDPIDLQRDHEAMRERDEVCDDREVADPRRHSRRERQAPDEGEAPGPHDQRAADAEEREAREEVLRRGRTAHTGRHAAHAEDQQPEGDGAGPLRDLSLDRRSDPQAMAMVRIESRTRSIPLSPNATRDDVRTSCEPRNIPLDAVR